MKGRGPYRLALRRGIGLGLALVAVWGVSLTADLSDLGASLWELGEEPSLAVGLLEGQMGQLPNQEGRALEGWGRMLLGQSALLAAGEEEVVLRRTQQGQEPEEPQPQEGDGDDEEEPDLEPQVEEDGIVEMTAQGKVGGQYLYGEGVYLYNRTSYELDASVLTQGSVNVAMGEGPQILIVHTHGSEAYSQTDGDGYEESDPYRTTDCTHNVVKVGEEMATVFRAHGFQVLHDTTLYDYPAYNGAYERSKAAVEQWLAEYPTIQVVLDVHRDALVGNEGEVYKLVSTEAGQKVAQVMLVVGTDDGGANHPNWKKQSGFCGEAAKGAGAGLLQPGPAHCAAQQQL